MSFSNTERNVINVGLAGVSAFALIVIGALIGSYSIKTKPVSKPKVFYIYEIKPKTLIPSDKELPTYETDPDYYKRKEIDPSKPLEKELKRLKIK